MCLSVYVTVLGVFLYVCMTTSARMRVYMSVWLTDSQFLCISAFLSVSSSLIVRLPILFTLTVSYSRHLSAQILHSSAPSSHSSSPSVAFLTSGVLLISCLRSHVPHTTDPGLRRKAAVGWHPQRIGFETKDTVTRNVRRDRTHG